MSNNQQALEKMHELKLYGMERAFHAALQTGMEQWQAEEIINHLIDAEWQERKDRKLQRHLKEAKFRYKASFDEIDFQSKRNLNANLIKQLGSCHFIDQKQDLILTGPTGTGKSFIASALGHQACLYGYKVRYFNFNKLFAHLKKHQAEGTYNREIEKLAKKDLLILDDFGLQPMDTNTRLMLLEIMEDRHGIKSTIMVSQYPVKEWFNLIGEPTLADAIMDRIAHTAYRIDLQGNSMRKNKEQNE